MDILTFIPTGCPLTIEKVAHVGFGSSKTSLQGNILNMVITFLGVKMFNFDVIPWHKQLSQQQPDFPSSVECTNCNFQFKAFPLIEWLRNYLWTSDLNCSHFYTDQSPICPTGEACVCSMTHSDNLGSMPDICVLGFFCFLADSL